MNRLFFIVLLIIPASSIGCPLEGRWLTDVDRTSKSLRSSKLIDVKKIEPIISILDEWEWVIDCDTWVVNHVGDHKFPEPVPREPSKYFWRLIDNKIEVEDEYGNTSIFEIETKHCISIYDEARGYKEYKCRVE